MNHVTRVTFRRAFGSESYWVSAVPVPSWVCDVESRVRSGRRRFMRRNRITCTGSAAVSYPTVLAHVNDAIREGAFAVGTIKDAVCPDVEE